MIAAGRDMSDGFWHAPIDFFSLVVILISGLELGLIGFSAAGGPWPMTRSAWPPFGKSHGNA
jgi:hypothetical protein